MKLANTFISNITTVILFSVLATSHAGAQEWRQPTGSMERAIQGKIDRCTIRTTFMAVIEGLESIIGSGFCSPQALNHYEDQVLQFIANCTPILPEAFTADALYNLDDLLTHCKEL